MLLALWGEEKTWKSTFALSFPKPLFHMDLDLGGFERAKWKLLQDNPDLRIHECEVRESISKLDWSKYDIVSKPYQLPIQMDKMAPKIVKGQQMDTGKLTVKMSPRVKGYRELWEEIVVDFVTVCQSKAQTIVPDSGTMMWTILHKAELQLKQEIQLTKNPNLPESELREKLQPVEFPNERMSEVLYTARSCRKHLVLTHYPKDVYAQRVTEKGVEDYRTGEVVPDGFKHTQKLVSAVIKLEVKKGKITATFTKCALPGMGTNAVGLQLAEVSYKGIEQLGESMKGE